MQLFEVRCGRTDVVKVYFVRFQLAFQKIVPFKNRVLVRVHETGAGLHVEAWIFLFHGLELARRVDDDVPRSGFLANFVMLFSQPVDAESHGDIQLRAFPQDSADIRKDSLLNLAIGCNVDRLEPVVCVKGSRDLRQVLSREWLAAGENQDAKISAKRFGDLFNFARCHLQFLSRTVIELFGEKAVRAAHVANRCH